MSPGYQSTVASPSSYSKILKQSSAHVAHQAFGILMAAQLPVVRFLGKLLRKRKTEVRVLYPTHQAAYPEGSAELRSSPEKMEEMIAQLSKHKAAWARTTAFQRATLARECASRSLKIMDELAEREVAHKGSYEAGKGEMLTAFYVVSTLLSDLATTLEHIDQGRQRTPTAVRMRETAGGEKQAVVTVLPSDMHDHVMLAGWTGQVWVEPGKEPTQGVLFEERRQIGDGDLCAVMGAGNQVNVIVGDIVQKMLVESCAVVCKMNPVNEYAGPLLEEMLQPLVRSGALRFAYGGGKEGALLCNHPAVDSMHITGSHVTHDAIVWGGQPKVGTPKFTKPISSELGCVSPVLVVPGKWADADLLAKARDVAAAVTHNASNNCLAAKVLVVDRDWPQRTRFLDLLAEELQTSSMRACYYPGSREKHAAFLKHYPQAQTLGASVAGLQSADTVPWVLLRDVLPRRNEYALVNEPWCGVFTELVLDTGGDPEEYMQQAAKVCNNILWGTLSCGVFVHPTTQKAHAAAVERLIADLKYGLITVNGTGLVGFGMLKLGWGGCAGTSTLEDVQSGCGVVHNTMMIDNVQKSVLRVPWSPLPMTPFWFPTNRNSEQLGRRLVQYGECRSLWNLFKVVVAALRG